MRKNRNREISIEIRKRIRSGKLRPEEQLPTRIELEQEFNVSCITMQKAIDSLVSEGTVYTKGKTGTFVSKFPREIYHYGLVFHHKPSPDLPWSRQWKVILQEAENIFSKDPFSLSVFFGDKYCLDANGNADFIEDIRKKRMAGLILTMHPELFEGTEITRDPEIPKVSLCPVPDFKLPSVTCDSTGIIGEMAKYLAGKKCSRTSMVMYSRQFRVPAYLDETVDKLKKHGLETHDIWLHGIDILFPESIANITKLMMRDKKFRPDSIMILDDNLIPGVIEGLKASNVRIPEDVELVAMANFPYDEKLDAPVKMFGFDIPEQLRLIKLKLDAIRQKQKYEKATAIKFVSDTEYAGKT